MRKNEERLTIEQIRKNNEISTYKNATGKSLLVGLICGVATAVDALACIWGYNNVDNDILKIIIIAFFGLRGVQNGWGAIKYGLLTGIFGLNVAIRKSEAKKLRKNRE
jgi:hypothetical protein